VTDTSGLRLVAAGALAAGYAVAALFFAKFWRRSRNRIFAWFTLAFALLALQRTMLALFADDSGNAMPWSYTLRLLAFVVILVGIVEQNRRRRA
jgi:membrane-associated PAP2 superfamily phosphatase